MRKLGFAEMNAFVATAERSSFAKAAVYLGISRSALSETIRGLEEKLGVRLLNRTTRSVALTEVGERLLAELRPALDSFEAAVESVNVFRDKPGGQLRLTVPRPAAKTVIEPILSKFLAAYPAISIEIITDSGLTDIVRDRFDAGIRPGHRVGRDMIAVRVGEDAPHHRRISGLSAPTPRSEDSWRSAVTQLHPHALCERRHATLGVRKARKEHGGPGQRLAHRQRWRPRAPRGAGRHRHSPPAAQQDRRSRRQEAARTAAGRLGAALGRFLSLLSQSKASSCGSQGLRRLHQGAFTSRWRPPILINSRLRRSPGCHVSASWRVLFFRTPISGDSYGRDRDDGTFPGLRHCDFGRRLCRPHGRAQTHSKKARTAHRARQCFRSVSGTRAAAGEHCGAGRATDPVDLGVP